MPEMSLSSLPVLVITTEGVSGAPSAAGPVKSDSCHNVNQNSPKGVVDLMLRFQFI